MCLLRLSVPVPLHLNFAATHILRFLRIPLHQGMVKYNCRQCSALTCLVLNELAAARGGIDDLEKMQKSERANEIKGAVLPIFKVSCVYSSVHSSVSKIQRCARVWNWSMQGNTNINARNASLSHARGCGSHNNSNADVKTSIFWP
jgi:hypothetical protein